MPELCPGCSRELTVDEIPRPGRRPLIVKGCWYCGTETAEEGASELRAPVMPPICVGAIF